MIRIAKLALVLALCAAAPAKSPLVTPVFTRVTNACLQSNSQQEAQWEKEATVVASGNEPTCPLDPETGTRMAIVLSGTPGNGIKQDVASTPARSLYLAYPSDPGTACGLTISDYSGDGPASYAATATATKVTAYGAGQTGIKVVGAGTTVPAATELGANLTFRLTAGEIIKDGNYLYVNFGSSTWGNYLKIFDVSNPAAITLAGALSDGVPYGWGLVKTGNKLYRYSDAYPNATQHIDVTNPAAPAITTTGGVGSRYFTLSDGTYVYTISATNTFNVGSLATNALVGTVAATAYLGGGMCKYGNYVYVHGSYYDDAANSNFVDIMDVTTPASPTKAATWNVGRATAWCAISGSTLFVSTYAAGTGTRLQSYSLANPLAPAAISTVNLGTTQGTISRQGNYIYYASVVDTLIYQVDVTNPAAMVTSTASFAGGGDTASYPTPNYGTSLYADTNYLYLITMAVSEQDRIRAIPIPFSTACASWCMSSVQIENTTASSAQFCGPTTNAAKSCKFYH